MSEEVKTVVPQAKIISLFSTKGGAGKTFVAVNLAVALAQAGKKILLLDLDLHAAQDMSRMLDVQPAYSMYDLSGIIDKIKQIGNLKEYITLVPSSGIDFFPAITRPKQAAHVTVERLDLILSILAPSYDYIVIDGGKAFSDALLTAFNNSSLILFVVTPDILSVYETRWGLDVLQSLHFPLRMIKLVLNRAESKSALSIQELQLALPHEILVHIPSEGRVVGLALNRGVPIVIDSPTNKASLAVKKLAHVLLTKDDLYIEHQQLLQLRTQTRDKVPKAGRFWDNVGLTEGLRHIEIIKEEDEVIKLKRRIHQRLIEELDLKRSDLEVIANVQRAKELRERAEKTVANLLAEETGAFLSSFEVRERLVKEICDEALGLGPLEDLLKDDEVSDIMVNGRNQVYVERNGRIELTTKKFISDEQVRIVIERVIAPLGRRVDESVPMVDARLPDGSRVNAIIPPLALGGPTLTIRKFKRELFTVDELLRFESLNQPIADFLRACVFSRKNIIVSGGTGSGKTTFLNILSGFIANDERIVTIEDAAELKLNQEHWVRLESRPPNIEGKGAITIRELFRNTLRMRPDRIIVGECRSGEVLDMLQAMNTGHDGSMTTVHANSTQDVLTRLDSMILMSGVELPIRAIREMIASAVHLIVHTARLSDGSRKVMQITEVAGMIDEMHIKLNDIFSFKQTGIDKERNNKVVGQYHATGNIPSFYEDILTRGIELPRSLFTRD